MLRARVLTAYRASPLHARVRALEEICDILTPFLCVLALVLATSYICLEPLVRYGDRLAPAAEAQSVAALDGMGNGLR
jgi:hypothetical protein